MRILYFILIMFLSVFVEAADKTMWEQNLREPFGNLKIAKELPRVQIDAVYGLRNNLDVVTSVITTGTYGVNDALTGSEFKVSTGTSSTGAASIQSHRALRYRSGQGATFRMSARFSDAKANSKQFIGGLNKGNWLGFGYNGTTFGIWHRAGGRQEIRTLVITGTASGAETATVTLNGVPTNVAVTAGTNSHNAFELSGGTYSGWTALSNNASVIFVKNSIGATTGSFGLTSTGSLAGTFSQTTAGQGFQTDTFIPQSSWNRMKLNGTVSSDPFVLSPLTSKGNVYQTAFQYLGYGSMLFSVENPHTGELVNVHTIENANAVSGPTLDNPTLKLGYYIENAGNTSNINLFGGSASGFVNGEYTPFRNPRGIVSSKTGVGTSFTNIVTIRIGAVFGGKINLADIFPYLMTVSTDGTKPGELKLIIGATLGGEPNWRYIDSSISAIEYDTAGTTVTGGQEVLAISLPKVGDEVVNLKDLDIRLDEGATITIAGRATTSITDITASLVWIED